jgi:serine protease Do
MLSRQSRSGRAAFASRCSRGLTIPLLLGLGCALLPSPAPAQGQAAGGQNLTQKTQRETQVPLQSLHPIVEKVMPAVVNVSVTMKPGAGGDAQGMAPGMPGGPNFPQSPFDQFLRRFFGERGGMGGMVPDQDQDQDQEDDQGGPTPGPGQGGGPGGAKRIALGSGFIIDPTGYVVTNNHVVEQAATVTIVLQDNSKHTAKIVGRDAKTDLALVKIDSKEPLPFVEWGDSDQSQVGDWVMAVGNPFGLGGSVTAGIISARGRDIQSGPYDDFLQIDAPINRGNSGGPTFNMSGEVIGINTAIYSPTGGSVGIGFAIPANLAKPVIAQIKDHGKVDRGWLGVQIQGVTPEIAKSLGLPKDHGALVADVTRDSPAAKAGIKQGDVIEKFNGHDVDRPRDLSIAVAETQIGKPAEVTVFRGGKEQTVQATIGEMPANLEMASNRPQRRNEGQGSTQQESALGMQFAPLTTQLRRRLDLPGDAQGVVVTRVAPDSPAAGDIQPGDIIQAIDQQPVTEPGDAAARLENAGKSKKNVLILINRQGTSEYVGLELG